MATNKVNGSKYKALYVIFGMSVLLGILFTVANQRTSFDSRAAMPYGRPTPVRQVTPYSYPRSTPTPTVRPTTTITPTTKPAVSFYLKTTDNLNANPGIPTTVVAGCNAGDIAVSAGMENYGGPINKWRTVRSTPSNSTDMNGFLVTMINEDTVAHEFTITAKCLKSL